MSRLNSISAWVRLSVYGPDNPRHSITSHLLCCIPPRKRLYNRRKFAGLFGGRRVISVRQPLYKSVMLGGYMFCSFEKGRVDGIARQCSFCSCPSCSVSETWNRSVSEEFPIPVL